MHPRLAVVDYGAGNLRSLSRALEGAGAAVDLLHAPAADTPDAVIVPGVGAFGAAMRRLEEAGFAAWIRGQAQQGTPLVGVCLGMQLLYASSEESPGVAGLALLPGRVRRLPPALKVPHMGWNALALRRPSDALGPAARGAYVYFVHAYYVEPDDAADVVATTHYGMEIPAVVQRGTIAGLQFHPEKSSEAGRQVLRHLVAWVGRC